MTDIWMDALAGLRPRLGAETYELWLRYLELQRAGIPPQSLYEMVDDVDEER